MQISNNVIILLCFRQVTVLYGSPEIYDYEIKHTFFHDVLFAAISFGLIVVLLFILTSFSLWLTIFGLLTIVFSVPFSYFVYRVLLRIDTIGILTGTTVFVIIGIGVDDVFVFINVFRYAFLCSMYAIKTQNSLHDFIG